VSSHLAYLDLLARLGSGGQGQLGNLDLGVPWVTPVYRERRGPEGFPDFLDFPGPLEVVDPRETEAVMVTPAVPALAWRVHGDPRVLMGLRDIRVLGNLVLRVSEARLENKDCEEWLEGLGLLAPLATVSSARRSGCKQIPEDRKKDKHLITDQMDLLPALYGLRLGNGLMEEFPPHTEHTSPHQITAQVVTLDNTQCLSLLIIIFIICCDTEYKQTL